MQYIILAIIKILDNVIMTGKSIATYKNKKILSSILVVMSQLMFYTIIKQVISDNSMFTIIIVSVASGIGNYIAFEIAHRVKLDDKWQYHLSASNMDDVMHLCHYLVENDIKYLANHGLTRKGKETINVIAYSKNKEQSRLIEDYLNNTETKYLKEIHR
jgi:hypothetical protein